MFSPIGCEAAAGADTEPGRHCIHGKHQRDGAGDSIWMHDR